MKTHLTHTGSLFCISLAFDSISSITGWADRAYVHVTDTLHIGDEIDSEELCWEKL